MAKRKRDESDSENGNYIVSWRFLPLDPQHPLVNSAVRMEIYHPIICNTQLEIHYRTPYIVQIIIEYNPEREYLNLKKSHSRRA